MKTHLSLGASNLERSVAFYSKLLDAEPAKRLPDYALFITEEPGLELALELRDSVVPAMQDHYGMCTADVGTVERAIERLTAAGLADSIERDETCCYANQTKVWAIDPDGRRWEIYTVHEETQERDGAEACCS